MSTHQIDTIARSFADELSINPVGDTFRDAVLKATGLFGGAVGVTALLASLLHVS
jgi:hypothetical protein